MKDLRFITVLFFALLMAFSACKKDHRVMGSGTQPAADALAAEYDSSTPVFAYTKKEDSIVSYNTKFKYLGCNNDPYFGRAEIGLYVNANIEGTGLNFNGGRLDSAEIILAIDPLNSVGDFSATTNYSVYAIDSALSATRLYYTNNTKLHSKSGLINSASFVNTSYKGIPVIRIPVDTAFAGKMFRNNDALSGNDAFQATYKGFYIKCASQNGAEGVIYKCDLENDLSGFYFRYRATSTSDTNTTFRFKFSGTSAARFNTVLADYTNATQALKGQVAGDTALGAQQVFVKGMGMTRVRLLMPSLKSYADSFKIAVNRAELVLTMVDAYLSTSRLYNPPPKLALLPVDSLGNLAFSLDQINATDLARYDGGYDAGNARYVFNIARHVQAILTGKKKNYGFYVVATDPDPTYTRFFDLYIERAGFYGSARGALRPTLNLSYIKFRKD